MRALVQRVSRATVRIRGAGSARDPDVARHPGEASVGEGLVVLVGVGRDDQADDARRLAQKLAALRIFEDEAGRMNRSIVDTGGSVLAVSQFTLYADLGKGNRPSFGDAASPDVAQALFTEFVDYVRASGLAVEVGVFGADMDVELVNRGPVTIWLDSRQIGSPRRPAETMRSTR